MSENEKEFEVRLMQVEKAVESIGCSVDKLNLLIIGNGKRGISEMMRDLNRISENLEERIKNIEDTEERLLKEKAKQLERDDDKKSEDKKKIIMGIVGALLLQIILSILRDPTILTHIFN